MKVEFYTLDNRTENLKFAVIQARFQGQWVFVRHKERTTWEIQGGHIEEGEDADSAAERELREETGAMDFQIVPVCNYSVESDGKISYGRLYFAEIEELGELEYEIEEIAFQNTLPELLTYSQIQPFLYEKIMKFTKECYDNID